MYRIIKTNGVEVGCTDTMRYIKVAENGCYNQCERQEAVGISYQSTPYNLLGHSEIAGAPQVIIVQYDAAETDRKLDELEQNVYISQQTTLAYLEGLSS